MDVRKIVRRLNKGEKDDPGTRSLEMMKEKEFVVLVIQSTRDIIKAARENESWTDREMLKNIEILSFAICKSVDNLPQIQPYCKLYMESLISRFNGIPLNDIVNVMQQAIDGLSEMEIDIFTSQFQNSIRKFGIGDRTCMEINRFMADHLMVLNILVEKISGHISGDISIEDKRILLEDLKSFSYDCWETPITELSVFQMDGDIITEENV